MEKLDIFYEGKTKILYSTNDPDKVIMYYKDDTIAFNGIKRASISNKGIVDCEISEMIHGKLEDAAVPTHFIKRLNEREHLCKKVTIFPFGVIVRNIIAGSMANRLNIKEGTVPPNTIYELTYKNEDLGNPLINDHHAIALGLCTYGQLTVIYKFTERINNVLKKIFSEVGIKLVDFKIEFGITSKGEIVLADEISPDTARFWDSKTNEKFDKDRFRQDLGNIAGAYQEILKRLKEHENK